MKPDTAASALRIPLPGGDRRQRRRTLIRAAAVLLRGVEQEEGQLSLELQSIVRRLDEIAAESGEGCGGAGPEFAP